MPLGSHHSSTAPSPRSLSPLNIFSTEHRPGNNSELLRDRPFFWGGGYAPSFRIIETESNPVDIGAVAEKLASSSSCQRGWKRTAADSLSGGTQPPLDLVDLGNPRLALGSLNPPVTPFPILSLADFIHRNVPFIRLTSHINPPQRSHRRGECP